eukprot:TRINITY_DN3442_c0_g3_i3.p1 TRINITY_DN3442_c0_g3~~TRINITY_DN3442_c0_g3_i3.p1  ORF type:complete len:517 (+),score=62.66 TRINITY_DN3442_c0_g3_i3:76-1626(+)
MKATDAPRASIVPTGQHAFSPFVAYAFTINYILGVGVLNLPHAMFSAGLFLGVGFLLLVSIVSAITMMYLVEVCARAEAIVTLRFIENETGVSPLESYGSKPPQIDGEKQPLIASTSAPNYYITSRKFEVNELCGIFLAGTGKLIFDIALTLYLYGGLWSYTAVFATSLTENIPFPGISNGLTCSVYAEDFGGSCLHAYYLYVLLFALIVIPLAQRDLTEQIPLQVFLCGFRFFALSIMIITSIVAIVNKGEGKDEGAGEGLNIEQPGTWVNMAGFGVIFSTAVFAQLVHHSTPGIVQPVKDKSKLFKIFVSSFTSTFVAYTILSIFTVTYFGPNTQQVITLNWKYYTGHSFSLSTVSPHWFPRALTYIVVLFPVLDIASAYPLNGITLGNNLQASFITSERIYTHFRGKARLLKVLSRLIATIPPIIMGMFFRHLSTIISIVGLFGFLIGFLVPAFLQYKSVRECERIWGKGNAVTPYSSFYSSYIFAYAILFFGGVSLLFAIIQLIFSQALHLF